jgi:hypothetical protein
MKNVPIKPPNSKIKDDWLWHRVEHIYLFFHVYCVGEWQEHLKEMWKRFPQSFIDKSTIFICASSESCTRDFFPGSTPEGLHIYYPSPEFPINKEWDTLLLLKKFCESRTDNVPVMYIMNKGVTNNNPHAIDWNHAMLYFLIENHEDACYELQNWDAVGCNLTSFGTGKPHFSGNFWMAWSDYVKRLKRPSTQDIKDRMMGEMWIGTGPGKLCSLHTSSPLGSPNHFSVPYKRDRYDYRGLSLDDIKQR